MKFEKLQPNQTLYDVHSYRMGNTTIRSMGVWPVKVLTIDPVARRALVSWNYNKPEIYFEHKIKKLREEKPVMVYTGFGHQQRLAKRYEIVKDGKVAGNSCPGWQPKKTPGSACRLCKREPEEHGGQA